jgi:hypothetical protein
MKIIVVENPSKTMRTVSAMLMCMAIAMPNLTTAQQSRMCSVENFDLEIKDMQAAIAHANRNSTSSEREVVGQAPCKETAKSDGELLKKGVLDAMRGLFKGKIPDPLSTFFKITLTSSETGNSSELCPILATRAEIVAADRIGKLHEEVEKKGCGGVAGLRLSILDAIRNAR